MKEITRRLYTKPVVLSMAFLVGMVMVVALFVTTKSTAAPNSFPLGAGNDEFETPDNGETFHDFGGSPVPANFFGTGSLAYSGLVALKGVPLGPGSNVDTVIQRHQAIDFAGDSTPLTMTGLSLASSSPITVTYSNNTTESWNVQVGLSDYKASTGTMTVHSSTFDSSLKVWPKFTFTRVGGGVPPKVLDTGAPTGPGLTAADSPVAADGSQMATATLIARCAVISDSEPVSDASATAAASTCPPVTLTSTNTPWGPCAPGAFCITVPITEEERWARHRPGPKGTIKQAALAE